MERGFIVVRPVGALLVTLLLLSASGSEPGTRDLRPPLMLAQAGPVITDFLDALSHREQEALDALTTEAFAEGDLGVLQRELLFAMPTFLRANPDATLQLDRLSLAPSWSTGRRDRLPVDIDFRGISSRRCYHFKERLQLALTQGSWRVDDRQKLAQSPCHEAPQIPTVTTVAHRFLYGIAQGDPQSVAAYVTEDFSNTYFQLSREQVGAVAGNTAVGASMQIIEGTTIVGSMTGTDPFPSEGDPYVDARAYSAMVRVLFELRWRGGCNLADAIVFVSRTVPEMATEPSAGASGDGEWLVGDLQVTDRRPCA